MDMKQILMNLNNLSSGYWEDYLITDDKKRAIIILRDWCIEKLKQPHPFGTPQEPIWRNRIDELSEISRVAVSLRIDMAVLISYMIFYFFLGKIVNRPKYVTDLGKFIVFPVPTALGAYVGYKISPYLITFLQ